MVWRLIKIKPCASPVFLKRRQNEKLMPDKNSPITPAQLAMIKTNVIWLTGKSTSPTAEYLGWWEKQDPFEMEQKAKNLTKYQASQIISEAILGNWEKVISLWSHLEV